MQSAQSDSPGATRSTVRPAWVMPPEDSAEMVLFAQVPLANCAAAYPVCRYSCESVEAPAAITFGSVAGVPMVPLMPASPLDTVTVTPAAVAWSLKSEMVSCAPLSGAMLLPNDSFSTSTCATETA